jgi:hypothetical protein
MRAVETELLSGALAHLVQGEGLLATCGWGG